MVDGKFNYHSKGNYGSYGENKKRSVYIGIVSEIEDVNDTGNLKIRIKGVDDNVPDSDLPNTFPLLPKFIHMYPKKGESVLVFTFTDIKKDRLWLGPITSQNQTLKYNDGLTTAMSGFDFGTIKPKKNPNSNLENAGSFPEKDYFALQGRDNADFIFKDNEILMRCGKIDINDKNRVKFNKKNPSYIQIKHNVKIDNKILGTTNVISDKINFITYNSKLKNYDLADQKEMLKTDTLIKIMEESQRSVYGDNLVEFLKLFIKAFISHVHPYNGDVPDTLDSDNSIDDLLNYDLDKLLNDNVKFN